MGIEYSRGLFIADLAWRPAWHHVEAIDRTLRAWKASTSDGGPELYDLDHHKASVAPNAAKQAMPANLLSMYLIEGAPVEAIMGPPLHPLVDDPIARSLEIWVVLGVAFKLHRAYDYRIELLSPPKDGTVVIEQELDEVCGGDLFLASWTTTPPKTRHPRGTFSGIWRSGIVFDCRKDLPKRTGPLPRELRAELERVLDTELVDMGWVH